MSRRRDRSSYLSVPRVNLPTHSTSKGLKEHIGSTFVADILSFMLIDLTIRRRPVLVRPMTLAGTNFTRADAPWVAQHHTTGASINDDNAECMRLLPTIRFSAFLANHACETAPDPMNMS